MFSANNGSLFDGIFGIADSNLFTIFESLKERCGVSKFFFEFFFVDKRNFSCSKFSEQEVLHLFLLLLHVFVISSLAFFKRKEIIIEIDCLIVFSFALVSRSSSFTLLHVVLFVLCKFTIKLSESFFLFSLDLSSPAHVSSNSHCEKDPEHAECKVCFPWFDLIVYKYNEKPDISEY